MKVANYFGDDRLRHRVVYSKKTYTECIYCGEVSKTREHVPSKVFLSEPYPENLPTLPACFTCNNSYSDDELFLSLLIQILKKDYFGSEYEFPKEVISRIENERNVELMSKIYDVLNKGNLNEFYPQIFRVLTKLAIGHSVWEISEGYYTDDEGITSDSASVSFSFLSDISQEEVDKFLSYFIITHELLPEVGSRAYDERILVLESDGKEPQLILNWVEVQPSEYIYTCYKFGNEIVVKIAINSFLFAEVILKQAP